MPKHPALSTLGNGLTEPGPWAQFTAIAPPWLTFRALRSSKRGHG